jgi:hypothetical protein
MRGRLVDRRGGRRRMRGRLDVVERERQGQEAIVFVEEYLFGFIHWILRYFRDRD